MRTEDIEVGVSDSMTKMPAVASGNFVEACVTPAQVKKINPCCQTRSNDSPDSL